MAYRYDFWHKIKMYNFDPYNVLLAITTNTLMTASVLQGHIYLRHDTEAICNVNRLNALWRGRTVCFHRAMICKTNA